VKINRRPAKIALIAAGLGQNLGERLGGAHIQLSRRCHVLPPFLKHQCLIASNTGSVAQRAAGGAVSSESVRAGALPAPRSKFSRHLRRWQTVLSSRDGACLRSSMPALWAS